MKNFKRLYLLSLLLFLGVHPGFSQDFDIKHYDIDMTLKENGALKVKETIDVFFTKAKHGIYKDIPTRYTIEYQPHLEKARYKWLQNDLLTMPVSGIKVHKHPYQLDPQENYLRIKIGDADETVEGNQQYIIEYEVDNIVAFYQNHSEINWNLIGEQWKARVEKATYTVRFPHPNSPGNPITYSTFTGSFGSTANDARSVWVNDHTLKGNLTASLDQEQAWTLNLFFPSGYLPYEQGDASFLAKKFIVKNYDTHYTLHKDGSTDVTLRADVTFINTVHWMQLEVENFDTDRRFGISGRWLSDRTYYPIENVKWQGGTQDADNPFKIHFDNLQPGDKRRVQLSYTLKGNIVADADHAGYSKLLFRNKSYFLGEPVLSSKTTITLPVSAVMAKWQANVRAAFNNQNLTSRTEGNDIIIESKAPVYGKDNFYQPSVSLPNRAVSPASFGTVLQRGWMNNYWLLYPLLLLGFVIGIWYKKGRDARMTIVPEYYPPQNITPAEAGILIDDKLNKRDIIALIPYWASQGLIKVEEIESKMLWGLMKNVDYKFIQLQPLGNQAALYEHRLFNGLFGWRKEVLLSSLRLVFYRTMEGVEQLLKDKIKADKQYEGKGIDAGKAMLILGCVILLFAFMVTSVSMSGSYAIGFFSPETGVGTILLGLGMLFFSRKMPKKSLKGRDVYQKLAGYRMFMQSVEVPRLQQLIQEDPHYFDKTLPYAMVFNMTDNWSQKFESINIPPPSWYSSNVHGLSSSQFVRHFSSATQTMSSTFTEAPSKSGSSGGGSSSGGGFGGGGGGSW
ncbi:MAG: DUF2207 domain-containing protein [Spirosomataceae bacterium]